MSAALAASESENVKNIVLANSRITNVGIAILSPNRADASWRIVGNSIANTGDSAIILEGRRFTIARNTIARSGTDSAIDYGKHGVYAKGPGARIINNTILNFASNGISTRHPNATIIGNTIYGGPIGIAYFEDARSPGTTRIAYNRIWDVDRAGIYLDGSSVESFLIVNNSVRARAGAGMHLKTVLNLTVANNLVTTTSEIPLVVRKPLARYREHHNLWHSVSGPAKLNWEGNTYGLAAYRGASGEGFRDKTANPNLNGSLEPRRGSPAIDSGTVNVSSHLTYTRVCRTLAFHYCGRAPDMGAVEVRARAVRRRAP